MEKGGKKPDKNRGNTKNTQKKGAKKGGKRATVSDPITPTPQPTSLNQA
jgi:hypothetical protein